MVKDELAASDTAVHEIGGSWNEEAGLIRVGIAWMMPIVATAILLLVTGEPGSSSLLKTDSPLFIPAAAHVTGAEGTNWRTDVEIFNVGGEQASYEIALLEKNQDNSTPATVSFSLNPGMAVRYDDILDEVFEFTGSAALRITANQGEVVSTSRTYNLVTEGTYGQFIGALADSAAIQFGQQGRIIQLTHSQSLDTGFRTNVGFLNTTPSTITVRARMFASDGTLYGTRNSTLEPYSFTQKDRIFGQVTDQDVDDGYVVVETTTPEGRLFAYASVVDNRTGDPVYVPAVVHTDEASGEVSYVAATAHVSGAGGTNWRTDLELHNPGAAEGQYEIALLETNRNNESPDTAVFSVAPEAARRLEDVLDTVFEYDGTAALRVSPMAEAELEVTSRTYNLTDVGTHGQFLGGVLQSAAIEQ